MLGIPRIWMEIHPFSNCGNGKRLNALPLFVVFTLKHSLSPPIVLPGWSLFIISHSKKKPRPCIITASIPLLIVSARAAAVVVARPQEFPVAQCFTEYHSAQTPQATKHNTTQFDNCYVINTLKILFQKPNGHAGDILLWEGSCVSRVCPARSFGGVLEKALVLLFLRSKKRAFHKRVRLLAGGERRRAIAAWVHRCRQTEAAYCSSGINAKCILSPFDVVICAPTPLERQPSPSRTGARFAGATSECGLCT